VQAVRWPSFLEATLTVINVSNSKKKKFNTFQPISNLLTCKNGLIGCLGKGNGSCFSGKWGIP